MSKWAWCLVDDDGKLLTNWCKVGDNWYLFNDNGTMKCSEWYKDNNGKWYYFNNSGAMVTGWIQYKDKWYYFYEATNAAQGEYIGTTAYSCTKTLSDGKTYTFDENGAMVENSSLVSDELINFVKSYEGFSATKYDDGTGVITQGYGCIGNEIADWGNTITEQQASDRLKELINDNYAKLIKDDLDSKSVTLTQCQFDSLASCAYNIGVSSLLGSTLYKYITSGGKDTDAIKNYFCMWSRAGGKLMQGLYNRRCEEADMFNLGDYNRDL